MLTWKRAKGRLGRCCSAGNYTRGTDFGRLLIEFISNKTSKKVLADGDPSPRQPSSTAVSPDSLTLSYVRPPSYLLVFPLYGFLLIGSLVGLSRSLSSLFLFYPLGRASGVLFNFLYRIPPFTSVILSLSVILRCIFPTLPSTSA